MAAPKPSNFFHLFDEREEQKDINSQKSLLLTATYHTHNTAIVLPS
jgi:hypothetical protein